MRLTPILAASALLASAACSRQPSGAATANAEAIADQLEARADNLETMTGNSVSGEVATALENDAAVLDEHSANLRAAANPDETVK